MPILLPAPLPPRDVLGRAVRRHPLAHLEPAAHRRGIGVLTLARRVVLVRHHRTITGHRPGPVELGQSLFQLPTAGRAADVQPVQHAVFHEPAGFGGVDRRSEFVGGR
ncbi:hypothetical protein [Saccharomonospora sp. CUA-673]|uniref:hypothetical protein n=1 Tax=Saccharomonospora sp. CUA-673 TaxID=1904969 RepID=UPI001C9E3274|nr:hypothetical protein [Saccharomonospora sp. CUA-673]